MDQAEEMNVKDLITADKGAEFICYGYGVNTNDKLPPPLFSYDPRKWYGPLHRYNKLITIRNMRVELGLRLSYGK